MNITIINPSSMIYSFGHQTDVHDYFAEFIKMFNPSLFFTNMKHYIATILLFYHKGIDFRKLKIIHTINGLQGETDVLIYPWGYPSSEKRVRNLQKIFSRFDGLKIFHAMDFHFNAYECNKFCQNVGIDYIMGYSRYDVNSEYFCKIFPNFIEKVIDIPFGYSKKWENTTPFSKRKNRCLGSGTIEPFDWLIKYYPSSAQNYEHYFDYFTNYNCMHELRWLIDQKNNHFTDILDNRFHNKSIDHPNYIPDIVNLFNDYKLFINDESLLNFPPIRTYEGIAAGCVMVAHENGCYRDYGFEAQKNYIAFNKYDLSDLADKIRYYLFSAREELEEIQKNGYNLVINRFNHKSVAKLMYEKIQKLYKTNG